jgi:hypothetical protein
MVLNGCVSVTGATPGVLPKVDDLTVAHRVNVDIASEGWEYAQTLL